MAQNQESNNDSLYGADLTMNIIKEIKNTLIKEGITITELAGRCGFSRPQLSRFLNLRASSSFNGLMNIIDALGYKVEIQSKHKKENE